MSAGAIKRALAEHLGIDCTDVRLTAGGDINDAYRAETAGGPLFIKTSAGAQPGMFTDEAAGLEWLGEPGALRVPEVAGVVDPPGGTAGPRLLALRWIERGSLGADGEEALGRGLAAVHAAGAPEFGATPVRGGGYGHSPMRFNELALPNEACATWAEFYAGRRIIPLTHACVERGSLDRSAAELMERVAARMPELAGPEEPPARIHGDLWSGNVLADASGVPYLIDPVAHGGHRELDLALLKVFGGPSERCFAAYREAAPLASGWEEREQLWQLAMILLHVYLFGRSYAGRAESIAREYV